ncbi:MAG: Na+/H+ antiporter NhaC family protein [Prevotellaceae bacterium]|nr:Na+/H+ antiporter NhaC family protein [Prevotellaceae bacterium]
MERISTKRGLAALSPLAVFLGLYLALSLLERDFYAVPITVAFLLSSVYSVCLVRGKGLDERVRVFSKGAAQGDLLLMIWIFILAGAFASSAKHIGSVEATVNLCLILLPPRLILASVFLASCLVSLSVGTSVGTIAALTPVSLGLAQASGAELPLMVATVVGGAFFGDNLSFISDTTIVATRTQGCRMRDKFRANLRIALPAAIVVLGVYVLMGLRMNVGGEARQVNWLLVAPYLLVLVTALCGVNVLTVLVLGIGSTCLAGICDGGFRLFQWMGAMGEGILGMGELIIVTLLASGMTGVIRHLGGIDFLVGRLTRRIRGRRGAELTVAALAVLTDLCTANNTIAILTVGSLAREISVTFRLDPRRVASLLDTFSCFAQGIIPYGAQLLIAAGLAGLNPLQIIPYLYYPLVLGVAALLSILWGKRTNQNR